MGRADVQVTLPDWVESLVPWDRRFGSDEEKMRLVVDLARENVERQTGGPFGAAVFECETGTVVGVGVNAVLRSNNSTLHAEMVAFMMAQQRVGSYSLGGEGLPKHELVTSCEPCAMCLGAVLWSGVCRVVVGASREDANRTGFDEGPVFPESHRYLEERGVRFERYVLRDEAARVLTLYRERGGIVYNG